MRLDQALVAQGIARSRTQAARAIADGKVTVDGRVITRAAHRVGENNAISAAVGPWVSRAAHKLIGALDQSGQQVPQRVLDAGASTGGFTQVCLARGARRVYAFDVGHHQLAPQLAEDPRVVRRDGLNLRNLELTDVDDQPVGMVVADVSFISLTLLLPRLLGVLADDGVAMLLVKPQFEVGKHLVGAGGIVREEAHRLAAVERVVASARELGWRSDWQAPSVLPGSDGNQEHFVRLAS